MKTRSNDRQTRIIRCLEALYAWEREDEPWLRASMAAISSLWDGGAWSFGFFYDASDPERFAVTNMVFHNVEEPVQRLGIDVFRGFPPSFVSKTYRSLSIGFGRTAGSEIEGFYRALEQYGIADIFGVNGLDPSGIGCFVGIGAPARVALSPQEVSDFQRMSSHLASAYRCRRRVREAATPAVEQAEVIARKDDGWIVEARGPAQSRSVRESLTQQISSIQRVRTRGGEEPAATWLPRLQGRWTLIEGEGGDKERYLLGRENLSVAPALASLTERELQVVASLSIGRSTKEAAYDLGISDATVRVLLTRAYSRLGVHSRKELLQLPAVRALREGRSPESPNPTP